VIELMTCISHTLICITVVIINWLSNLSSRTQQAEYANHDIRRIIISSMVVSTLAGQAGTPGSANGAPGTFNYPYKIAMDAAGTFALVVSLLFFEASV